MSWEYLVETCHNTTYIIKILNKEKKEKQWRCEGFKHDEAVSTTFHTCIILKFSLQISNIYIKYYNFVSSKWIAILLHLLHRFKSHKPQFVVRFQHIRQCSAHFCNLQETHSRVSLRIPEKQRKSLRKVCSVLSSTPGFDW